MSMYLFKKQVNKRGLFLLSCFCLYAIVLLMPSAKELIRIYGDKTASCSMMWGLSQWILLLSTLSSLINPVIILFKPGFSYKGHPGSRHILLLLSGASIITISFLILITNYVVETSFLSTKSELILYALVYPLHGIHSITVYCSYFKGPTSKFGKIYQPYLPIIE